MLSLNTYTHPGVESFPPIQSSPLQHLQFQKALTEWGLPHGSLGRLFPMLALGQTPGPVLWITDQTHMVPYPKAMHNLGISLQQFHFVQRKEPLKNLKTVFTENVYTKIVLDTSEFLKKGDLSFLSRMVREHKTLCFLIRPFFLSFKQGNPFSKHRINVSFCLTTQKFRIDHLKGGPQKRFFLPAQGFFL